ncbi:MAG TPA: META domain-containing protein [Iamia sp.]
MHRHLVILLAALLTLASCGDDGDDVAADATTAPVEDPVAGRTFEATTLEGDQAPTLVEGVTLRITFGDDDQITVDTGCNHLTGTYAVEGPILVVQAVGGTEMSCTPGIPGLEAQEDWIGTVLTQRPVITPAPPDGLTLSDEGWTLTLVEPSAEAVELAGAPWTADTIVDREEARSLPAGVTVTITFADDGTYEVSAGCNTGSGTYAEAGAGIYQIEPPNLTRRRCDDAAMEVEAAVVATLDGEVTASIEEDRLTLTSSEGAGLAFTAA